LKIKKRHGFHSAAVGRNQIKMGIAAYMECASSACAFEGGAELAALQIQPWFMPI
jgi:hypothetical protein